MFGVGGPLMNTCGGAPFATTADFIPTPPLGGFGYASQMYAAPTLTTAATSYGYQAYPPIVSAQPAAYVTPLPSSRTLLPGVGSPYGYGITPGLVGSAVLSQPGICCIDPTCCFGLGGGLCCGPVCCCGPICGPTCLTPGCGNCCMGGIGGGGIYGAPGCLGCGGCGSPFGNPCCPYGCC